MGLYNACNCNAPDGLNPLSRNRLNLGLMANTYKNSAGDFFQIHRPNLNLLIAIFGCRLSGFAN